MSASALVSNSPSITQLHQCRGTHQAKDLQTDASADLSAAAGSMQEPKRGGGVMDAVLQALSQVGAVGAPNATDSESSDASPSSAPDVGQALQSFLHNLFSALHAQQGTATADQGDTQDAKAEVSIDASTSVSTPGAVSGPHHGHHGGIAADLQSLIQQLSSSDGNSTGSDQSPLQKSFQGLMSALGSKDPQATLGNFLQALSKDLPNASPLGNVVSTHV